MNCADAGLHYPVLGFTRDLQIWGFKDLDALTRCGPRTLRENYQADMELIDADGRRWRVRTFKRIGRAGSWLSLLLPFGPPQSRIEHELEAMEPVSIQEVQRRTCASMEAFSENYFDAGEREAEFAPLLAQVNRTRKIADIYELLQPDTFEPH